MLTVAGDAVTLIEDPPAAAFTATRQFHQESDATEEGCAVTVPAATASAVKIRPESVPQLPRFVYVAPEPDAVIDAEDWKSMFRYTTSEPDDADPERATGWFALADWTTSKSNGFADVSRPDRRTDIAQFPRDVFHENGQDPVSAELRRFQKKRPWPRVNAAGGVNSAKPDAATTVARVLPSRFNATRAISPGCAPEGIGADSDVPEPSAFTIPFADRYATVTAPVY
jgi:hypothetical protein